MAKLTRRRKRSRRKPRLRDQHRSEQNSVAPARKAVRQIMQSAREAPSPETATPAKRAAVFDQRGNLVVAHETSAPAKKTTPQRSDLPGRNDLAVVNDHMKGRRDRSRQIKLSLDFVTGQWDRSPDKVIADMIAAKRSAPAVSYLHLTLGPEGQSVRLMLNLIRPVAPKLVWLGDLGGYRGQNVLGKLDHILSTFAQKLMEDSDITAFAVSIAEMTPPRGLRIELGPA